MRKRILSLVMVAVVMTGLMACSSGEKQPEAKQSEVREKLTISIHPSGHGFPAYIAEKNGYYEEEGLDVETLVYIGAPPQMEAYQAGAWDIGTTGFGGIVLGVAKKDLKIIGLAIADGALMGLWAREDHEIVKAGYDEDTGCYGTAEEWKGAEVLYTQGTITDILLISTLNKLGLSVSDVVRTNMDSSPAFTAFRAGNGDIVQANASFYLNAEAEGWVPITTGVTQEIFLPSVITASDKILKERPEVAEKWLRAYMKAVAWIKENQEEGAKIFVEFCEENGVATNETNALKFMDLQITKILPPEEQVEYFKLSEDGKRTVLQNSIAEIMDIYITMGNYTEDDKEALMQADNYDSRLMEKLK